MVFHYISIILSRSLSSRMRLEFRISQRPVLTRAPGLLFGDKNVRTYDSSGRAAEIVESPGTATPDTAEKEKIEHV